MALAPKDPAATSGPTPATEKGPAGSDPAGPGHVSHEHTPWKGRRLLQRSIDRREFVVEVRTQTVHYRDDRQRDTRRDQTVFNRGRTGLIGHEFSENTLQNCLLLGGNCDDANMGKTTPNDLRLSKCGRLNSNLITGLPARDGDGLRAGSIARIAPRRDDPCHTIVMLRMAGDRPLLRRTSAPACRRCRPIPRGWSPASAIAVRRQQPSRRRE